MNVKLGVGACFAVKRWPLGKDWVRIVKEDLDRTCWILLQSSFAS